MDQYKIEGYLREIKEDTHNTIHSAIKELKEQDEKKVGDMKFIKSSLGLMCIPPQSDDRQYVLYCKDGRMIIQYKDRSTSLVLHEGLSHFTTLRWND